MDVFEGGGVESGNITLKTSDGQEFGMNGYGFYSSSDIDWDKNMNVQGALSSDSAIVVQGNLANDEYFRITDGSFSGGQNPYTDGFVLNHGVDGTLLEMYSGGNQNININGDAGSITATTVTETSDVRYKTNITDLSGALENTLALRGVSYNWIDENKTQDLQIGVIAQEVEEIYPEFVHTDEEGMKSVNYSQMVAVLIEAVKELNSKIEVLEAENSELQAQINDIETMKAQISKLMTLISVETAQDSFSSDK